MPDNEHDAAPSTAGAIAETIGNVLEGGVPQLLFGPAGKALSRFLGLGVDVLGNAFFRIPAAMLDQKAQSVKDETAARTLITNAMAHAVSRAAVEDRELLERGLSQWTGSIFRAQRNKEAIGAIALEHLKVEPPPADAAPVDEDWMNVFEKHAENASSEKLRGTFARILAGEVRKPGSVSLATLHFLSVLDQKVAAAFEEMSAWCVNSTGIIVKFTELNFEASTLLRDAGILAQFDPDIEHAVRLTDGYIVMGIGERRLWLTGTNDLEVTMPLIALSRVGKELLSVISSKSEQSAEDALVEMLKGKPVLEAIYQAARVPPNQVARGAQIWTKEPEVIDPNSGRQADA